MHFNEVWQYHVSFFKTVFSSLCVKVHSFAIKYMHFTLFDSNDTKRTAKIEKKFSKSTHTQKQKQKRSQLTGHNNILEVGK